MLRATASHLLYEVGNVAVLKSLSMIVGSSDEDNAMEVSGGMDCTKL